VELPYIECRWTRGIHTDFSITFDGGSIRT
jgi:hypothetical protein